MAGLVPDRSFIFDSAEKYSLIGAGVRYPGAGVTVMMAEVESLMTVVSGESRDGAKFNDVVSPKLHVGVRWKSSSGCRMWCVGA